MAVNFTGRIEGGAFGAVAENIFCRILILRSTQTGQVVEIAEKIKKTSPYIEIDLPCQPSVREPFEAKRLYLPT